MTYDEWRAALVVRDDILGGEPVLPGTRVAVRQIGTMALRGAAVAEILADYAGVSELDVAYAKRYASER